MYNVIRMFKYISILFFIGLVFWAGRNYVDIDTTKLRDWILSFGLFSPFIFLLISALRPVIFFPFLILSIAGGLAFGVIGGTLLTILGGLIAATLSFSIARKYGRYFHFRKYKQTQRLQQTIEEKGVYYVFLLRIIPFLNFDLVSYASGISNVRFQSYFIGTMLGMFPGTLVLNFFGSTLVTGNSRRAIVIIAVTTFLFLLSLIIRRWMKSKGAIDMDE